MAKVQTIREFVGQDPEMREALDWSESFEASEPTDAEKRMGARLPGDGVDDHPIMEAMPNPGCLNWNPGKVKRAWEAGELTEREVLAYEQFTGEQVRPNQADPIPDMGGITQPYAGGDLGPTEGPNAEQVAAPSSGKKFPVVKVD